MLEHGGQLRRAAAQYGIPPADWLDLSTGINPRGWPVPEIPAEVWQRLPEEGDGLEVAAAAYYGSDALLAVAGSQAAIQALPGLRQSGRVGMVMPGYAEHAHAWRQAGHEVVALDSDSIDDALGALDCLLLINPNNPTGQRWPRERLLGWHARLAARGGWLVVDEAFVDATPENSLIEPDARPGLIVLRSLGKFFGLAGLRLGFVYAEAALRDLLRKKLGPWAVSHPARWVGAQALQDVDWQRQARERLQQNGGRLVRLLDEAGLRMSGHTPLFAYCETAEALAVQERFLQAGILLRRFDAPAALRFGLPGSEADWERLAQRLFSR